MYTFDLDPASIWYLRFFILAFGAAYITLLIKLFHIRKLNANYLTIAAALFLVFVIGCKLITLADHFFYASSKQTISQLGQMATGGVILTLLLLLLLKPLLHLDIRFVNAFALALLVGLLVQKPGCLLGGCCYAASNGIINVHYGPQQFGAALPLYELISYALLIFILVKYVSFNSRFFFLLSFIGYSIIQIFAEFARGETQAIAFNEVMFGLKIMQWIYVALMILAVLLYFSYQHSPTRSVKTPIWQPVSILLLTLLLLIVTKNILYRTEVWVINLALLPSIGYCIISFFKNYTVKRYRIALIPLTILPLFLMSQTLSKRDTITYSYHAFGGGFKTGKSTNYIVHDTDPDNCGGIQGSNAFEHKYNVGAITYSYTTARLIGKEFVIKEIGANASFGKHQQTTLGQADNTDFNIISLNPYGRINTRWFGMTVGLHLGANSNLLIRSSFNELGDPESGSKQVPIVPQVALRVGPQRIFFAEYSYANHSFVSMPEIGQDFAFGSGFGLSNGTYLKFGILMTSEQAYYMSANIPIKNTIIIAPTYKFGQSERGYRGEDSFALSVKYLFNKKRSESVAQE